MTSRHLDHGYMFAWASYMPKENAVPDRPHLVDRMHASVQCYPAMYLRPYHWREMVPGTSVAVHVRSGVLILRLFFPPDHERINDRAEYFAQHDAMERDRSTCSIVEVLPGELM